MSVSVKSVNRSTDRSVDQSRHLGQPLDQSFLCLSVPVHICPLSCSSQISIYPPPHTRSSDQKTPRTESIHPRATSTFYFAFPRLPALLGLCRFTGIDGTDYRSWCVKSPSQNRRLCVIKTM